MAVRFLHDSGEGNLSLSASVCVVGAGMAGLIAATRLARSGLRVIVVESGMREFDAALSLLDEIDNQAGTYPMQVNRCRGLGGTSLLWSGKLLPLSRSDARPRPYLGLDGWPFDISELDGYLPEIEALMGVDDGSYEEDATDRLDPRGLLAQRDAEFSLRWPKRPTRKNHDLGYVLRREIAERGNLEIWLGATVTGFLGDASTGLVTSLKASDRTGRVLSVAAMHYVIAAGALESTRLLLLADRQLNCPISSDGDVLGRYFNDHLGIYVAALRPRDAEAANWALADRIVDGSGRHLHFELRGEVQEAYRVGSAYFDIAATRPEGTGVERVKALVRAVKVRAPAVALRELLGIGPELPALFRTARWERRHKTKHWSPGTELKVEIRLEQLPCRENRICLSDKVDRLGVPMLRLEWRSTEADEKALRLMVAKCSEYWRRHLMRHCELEWYPVIDQRSGQLAKAARDLAHPAGSTRMGTSPMNSVVDPKLTAHRIPNLSIASSSVFPSSGSANPTLAIMQLAMRAADAVAERLRARIITVPLMPDMAPGSPAETP
jgi:choline dehydrogenase-like flavoprotein